MSSNVCRKKVILKVLYIAVRAQTRLSAGVIKCKLKLLEPAREGRRMRYSFSMSSFTGTNTKLARLLAARAKPLPAKLIKLMFSRRHQAADSITICPHHPLGISRCFIKSGKSKM
jgi:hypothetical protein